MSPVQIGPSTLSNGVEEPSLDQLGEPPLSVLNRQAEMKRDVMNGR
jgi:hypothetical protein